MTKIVEMNKYSILMAYLLSLCMVSCRVVGQVQESKQGPELNGRSVPVTIATIEQKDHLASLSVSGPGTVTAYNTVHVKSRVDGQIVKIVFDEGKEVKAGDLLALIDPRPFEATLHQLEASYRKDEASLKDARANLDRYRALYEAKLVAEQQVDLQAAMVTQAEGTLTVDQAQIEGAMLNLEYTRISSPIDGRVGFRLIDVGNMVHPSDTAGIVTVTQLRPITVQFTLPEQYLANVLNLIRRNNNLEVNAYSQDDAVKLASGRLLTIDSQNDITTGTPRLKAVFQNSDLRLWPNESVNVRIVIKNSFDELSIPSTCIHHDRDGTFVYLAKLDNTIEIRYVTASYSDGVRTSIRGGLAAGDVVVTRSEGQLQNGTHIEIKKSLD